jgi:hypothetical protein
MSRSARRWRLGTRCFVFDLRNICLARSLFIHSLVLASPVSVQMHGSDRDLSPTETEQCPSQRRVRQSVTER